MPNPSLFHKGKLSTLQKRTRRTRREITGSTMQRMLRYPVPIRSVTELADKAPSPLNEVRVQAGVLKKTNLQIKSCSVFQPCSALLARSLSPTQTPGDRTSHELSNRSRARAAVPHRIGSATSSTRNEIKPRALEPAPPNQSEPKPRRSPPRYQEQERK
jgi:hypothetical protein